MIANETCAAMQCWLHHWLGAMLR